VSYDVDIATSEFNYTYNLAQFFIEFGVHPYGDLSGQTGEIAAWKIDDALARIVAAPVARLNEFNPENGWGDWPSAVRWLMEIRDAARANPGEIVRVS
jgi:hypothetical protein